MLKEYIFENNIVVMNLTETWLKEEDQDEKIPNYTTFRSDRKGAQWGIMRTFREKLTALNFPKN